MLCFVMFEQQERFRTYCTLLHMRLCLPPSSTLGLGVALTRSASAVGGSSTEEQTQDSELRTSPSRSSSLAPADTRRSASDRYSYHAAVSSQDDWLACRADWLSCWLLLLIGCRFRSSFLLGLLWPISFGWLIVDRSVNGLQNVKKLVFFIFYTTFTKFVMLAKDFTTKQFVWGAWGKRFSYKPCYKFGCHFQC